MDETYIPGFSQQLMRSASAPAGYATGGNVRLATPEETAKAVKNVTAVSQSDPIYKNASALEAGTPVYYLPNPAAGSMYKDQTPITADGRTYELTDKTGKVVFTAKTDAELKQLVDLVNNEYNADKTTAAWNVRVAQARPTMVARRGNLEDFSGGVRRVAQGKLTPVQQYDTIAGAIPDPNTFGKFLKIAGGLTALAAAPYIIGGAAAGGGAGAATGAATGAGAGAATGAATGAGLGAATGAGLAAAVPEIVVVGGAGGLGAAGTAALGGAALGGLGASGALGGGSGASAGVGAQPGDITVVGNPGGTSLPGTVGVGTVGTGGLAAGATGGSTPPVDSEIVVEGQTPSDILNADIVPPLTSVAIPPLAGTTLPSAGGGKGLSTYDYIRLASLGIGTLGKLFGGGGGGSGATISGNMGALNPVFGKQLPTANIPGLTAATAGARAPSQSGLNTTQDWYRYGYGPEQSFFNSVPMAQPNTSQAYTGYAEGGFAVEGPGDGRDDQIPAMLSDGEYVIDAETVALLGNGSPKAGADLLDQFRVNVRKHKGQKLAKGEFSDDAKRPEHYMAGGRM